MDISEIYMSEEFNAALNTPEVKKILPHYAEGIKYAERLSNMRHLKKALKQVMAQKSPPKHIKP